MPNKIKKSLEPTSSESGCSSVPIRISDLQCLGNECSSRQQTLPSSLVTETLQNFRGIVEGHFMATLA